MVITLCRWVFCGFLFSLPHLNKNFPLHKHPLYVSVTEINHNAKDKILEVSCKIFTDDFENTLTKFSNTRINLSDQKAKAATDQYISAYIIKHLQLKVDGRPVSLQFIGSENEAEATWSYFQVNDIASVKNIDIMNDLLYESYETEINIIHVMVNGNRQSTKLDRPETKARFEF
ncbi:MAG TPA: DUF6702 family protein [Puia sp.]|nr:DUF6702 family protein [Puia sp.]